MESITIQAVGPTYEEAVGEAMVRLTECSGNKASRVFRKEVPEDAVPFVDWALDIVEAELSIGGHSVAVECTFWLIGSDETDE